MSIGGKIGFAFKVIGGLVMAGPAIEVISTDVTAGKFDSIPNDLLFAYTGLGGTTQINTTQTLKGIGAVGGGAFFMWLGGFISRTFR